VTGIMPYHDLINSLVILRFMDRSVGRVGSKNFAKLAFRVGSKNLDPRATLLSIRDRKSRLHLFFQTKVADMTLKVDHSHW